MNARSRRCVGLLLATALLAGCGQDAGDAAPAAPQRSVTGSASKGPLQSATVDFFAVDAAGNPTGPALVPSVTTNAAGGFVVSGLPAGVPVLVKTSGGTYVDESDPEPNPGLRRRITFLGSENLLTILPAGATSVAITPYSMALYLKARVQANGGNFANTFEAVQSQATAVFGFDPFLTIPADPITGTGGDAEYAILLGAAAQAINAIAVNAGHLPAFADVAAFVNDLADGRVNGACPAGLTPCAGGGVDLNAEIRRFRNNNFGVYGGTALPVIDEAQLEQPASVPNAAPVANADAITVAEGGTATILQSSATSVLANDTDAENQTLSAALVSGPLAAGAFTLNADGTFSYAHDGSETFGDSFDYVANDGTDDSVAATVSITVTPVNDAPSLDVNAGLSVDEGTALALTIFDLSASDPDNLDTAITFTVTGGPANGQVLLNGVTPTSTFTQDQLVAGAVSYVHGGGEAATDSFTFNVDDGSLTAVGGPFTFSIAILPANDPPTISDILDQGISEDGATGVLTFTIADAETVAATLVVSGDSSDAVLVPVTPANLAFGGTGGTRSVVVTPAPDQSGSTTITVTVDDGVDTASDTFIVTVAAVNDAPVAGDDPSYTGTQGGTVATIAGVDDLLLNDTDVDNTPAELSVTTTPVRRPQFASAFTLNADGSFSYTHNGSVNRVDSFDYEVCDLAGPQQLCDIGTATVTLDPAPATIMLLPFVTASGQLKVYDPTLPLTGDGTLPGDNPLIVDTGVTPAGFKGEVSLHEAVIDAGTGNGTDLHQAGMVYVKGGRIYKIDLRQGGGHFPAQVSDITDACDVPVRLQDFAAAFSSALMVETDGANGLCEIGAGGTGDDEFRLVQLAPTGTGTQVVTDYPNIVELNDVTGARIGSLGVEGSCSGVTQLVRRDAAFGSPATVMNLQDCGLHTAEAGFAARYLRAHVQGDPGYRLHRYNVAAQTVDPALYTYTVDTGSIHNTQSTFDATNFYFTDGNLLSQVPHAGTAVTALATAPAFIERVAASPNAVIFEVGGTSGGVFAVPIGGGGGVVTLGGNTATATHRLASVEGTRVFINKEDGGVFEAYHVQDDGSVPTPIAGVVELIAQTVVNTHNFRRDPDRIPSFAILGLDATGGSGSIIVVDPGSGAAGLNLGPIPNAADGRLFGIGRYALVEALIDRGGPTDTDIWALDTLTAGSLAPLAQSVGGNDFDPTLDRDGGGANAVAPPPGMVAWYPGDGDASDIQGLNHGTLVGGPTFATGKVNQAFVMDGVDDHVFVAANDELTGAGQGSGLTIDLWVNPAALGLYPFVEWNDTTAGPSAGVHFWSDGGPGHLFANIRDTSGGDHMITTPGPVLTTGVHQHVAVTWDKASGTAVLYHNGSPVQAANIGSGFTPQTGTKFYIGGARVGSAADDEYFPGQIDEVEVFSRALSAAEIQAIFDAGAAGKQRADGDGDGLLDGAEQDLFFTDPGVADSDGDTFSDGAEVSAGSNPNDPADVPGNQPPVIDTNTGLNVGQGLEAPITFAELSASDPEHAPSQLTYNLGPGPVNGAVLLNSVPTTSFTQADIDLGFVSYLHDGSVTTTDTFDFAVTDAGAPPLSSAAATFTISIAPVSETAALMPYLTAAGQLKLFNPASPGTPLTLEPGPLPTTGFEFRTVLRADVAGGVASNLRLARLVYIKSGKVYRVNLEPGQSHAPVQVSNIVDACRFNGMAEDFANPDNTIVRIDTAGNNGLCENGGGDDFTTAEAWLVPLATSSTAPGAEIGLGHCCGVAAINDLTGALTGVLATKDDGLGSSFSLVRRNVAALATDVPIATLEIAGTGQIYSSLPRGLGDQHIYLRALRTSVDTTYKLLRLNVADNTLTDLFDYGVSDAAQIGGDLDEGGFDAGNVYFTSANGQNLLKVAHAATGPGQAVPLVNGAAGSQIVQIEQAGDRIVFQAQGTASGVYSVPKDASAAAIGLALDNAAPTVNTLMGTDGVRVYINQVQGSTPDFFALTLHADGSGPSALSYPDGQWAGEQFGTSCDFNASCEGTIAAQDVFLRQGASTNDASIALINPVTGAATGDLFPTVFFVAPGQAVFGNGFGRYTAFTFFAAAEHLDLWLGDTQAADPSAPAGALALVANDAGDDHWLLFGDEGQGGPAPLDTDGDGLSDSLEGALGTNPSKPDTDGDGLTDFEEVNLDGNPNNYTVGVDTNPNDFDTDDDGMSDGEELAWYPLGSANVYEPGSDTSPFDPDSDNDDVGDGIEASTSSNPLAGNPVYRVDCAQALTGQDGTSWTDGAGSAGPLGSNADVVAAIGPGGINLNSRVFVLYAAGFCFDALDLSGGTPRSYVAFVGSVGPGVYDPFYPPTTTFAVNPGTPVISISQADNLALGNLELTGGSAGTGGGIFVHDTNGPVTNLALHSLSIHDNGAANGGGIALVSSGSGASLEVQSTEIFANAVSSASLGSGRGGGIYVAGSASLLVKDSRVRGNSATNTAGPAPTHGGGGIYAENGANVTIDNTIIADNRATNGPGGGVNLMAVSQGNVRNTMLLANAATRPGAGLHLHVEVSATSFDIFNNLIVGNASTDADAHGAGMEIEHNLGAPLTVSSNTIAYNQSVTNTAPSGGGLTISPVTGPSGPEFRNNIVAFNNDADLAAEPLDNAAVGTPSTRAGNNVVEPSFAGNSGTLPNGADPLFVLGFYLDQIAPSPSKDSGDGLANEANNFASGFYTTNPNADPSSPSTADQGAVDSGFHHQKGAPGVATSVGAFAQPGTASCPVATVHLTPFGPSGPLGPGHLVVSGTLTPPAGSPTLSGITNLQPMGTGTRLAVDEGNGDYRLDMSGSSSGSYSLDVYVDGAGPFTATFSCF